MTVIGALPVGTQLLIYEDDDPSTPTLYGKVENANRDSTTIYPRREPLAAHAPHHLEVLGATGRWASIAFETDSKGAALVLVAGVHVDPAKVIPLGEGREVDFLYLRTAGRWANVASNANDLHRLIQSFVVAVPELGELRLLDSNTSWNEGFLITTSNEVARLLPGSSERVIVEWIEASPARIKTDHLPDSAAMIWWSLAFLASDDEHGPAWRYLGNGEGSKAELAREMFPNVPFVRMRLSTFVRDGDEKGRSDVLDDPFR